MILTREFASDVYDILVKYAGARNDIHEKESFIQAHILINALGEICTEWRFCGNLGFGGKYRSMTNKVDCYIEDANTKRNIIIIDTNKALSELTNRYGFQF